MASTSLSQTAGTPTNQNTGTLSFWMKLGNIGVNNEKLYHTSGGSDSNTFTLQFQGTTDRLMIANNGGVLLILNRVLRDTSAWYHIVCVSDPSNATANQRLRIYINGVEETSMATDNRSSVGTSSVGISVNSQIRYISGNGSQDYFDGYMADYYFIDGQALSPTDFGQTDSTGIWKPKGYSGTYGTNGFYLKFSNGGDLGADSSGNGNNFTKSGNGRQRTDTPSNVFATINALQKTSSSQLLSNGNLEHRTTGNWMYLPATFGASSGKWYAEIKLTDATNFNVGVMQLGGASDTTSLMNTNNTILGSNSAGDAWALFGSGADTGTYKNNNTPNFGNLSTGFVGNWSNNDIAMIALDTDNQKIWFGRNGSWDNSGDPAAGTNPMPVNTSMIAGETYTFASGPEQGTQQWNFGNPIFSISSGNTDGNGYGNFEYAPPSGYLALCTKNLATELAPTIDDGSEYFNTVLYAGNSTDPTSITGVGFQPDWTWIKRRDGAQSHGLFDSSRGVLKHLESNNTGAEITRTDSLKSFDSDGFTVGDAGFLNETGETYAAWNWKANGGTTSSNSDGTITSTVQANTTTGLSIVTYTGNGTAGATVGHGLGVKPSWFVVKGRSLAGSWVNYHTSLGATKGIPLQGTSAAVTTSAYWNNTEPTSSVITLGYDGPGNEVNDSGSTFVAYCFADIEGYSKFGSYTGNGSTDGPFVYTGFRPAWIMIKRTDSTNNWNMFDSKRDVDNQVGNVLYANLSDAEGADPVHSSGNDFLSNGFKARETGNAINGSGASYIYMAFAENPFVTSGGLPVTAR